MILLLRLLLVMILCLPLVHTEPSGFINIDCGLPPGKTSYVEETGLTYVSDSSYIAAGESIKAPPESYTSSTYRHLIYVRSFPLWNRNCYNISLVEGKKYLIKAVFCYLNHDRLNVTPTFDLYLGNSKWVTVQSQSDTMLTEEVVHTPTRNYVFVCLVNTGRGTPFISALETRELDANLYETKATTSLGLYSRRNVGSKVSTVYRYPFDEFDRDWYLPSNRNWANITTTETIKSPANESYALPSVVMSTAVTPIDASKPLEINNFQYITYSDYNYSIFLHFAELVKLQNNQSRVFDIRINDLQRNYFKPQYLNATTFLTKVPVSHPFNISISASVNSTLPPLLNAYEIYFLINETPFTNQNDVDALLAIKSSYKILKNWEGDPCGPRGHPWQGVNCSFFNVTQPVVLSLNLSSSQLGGNIGLAITNLKNLEELDLSSNSLTGSIPEFLSHLPSLRVLNLYGNNLTGTLPESLAARSKSGSLSLNVAGNPLLCVDNVCGGKKKKKSKTLVLVAAIVGGTVAVLAVAVLAFMCLKKKGKEKVQKQVINELKPVIDLRPSTITLTYANILEITNNLASIIARGGSGTVYHGTLNKSAVAVKIISQDTQQFQMEVNYLLQIHHNNLTRLVGYCNEGNHLALIYQYMQNGNLQNALQNEQVVLDWNQRFHIALDSAQGLDYLHNHCSPPIIHRDIKTANILLDAQLRAKLSDFGLSKSSPIENGTRQQTRIVGTPGYLDPEYWETSMVTMWSDVYSFGIVLLEIISGRNPKSGDTCGRELIAFAESNIKSGDIKSIIDPKLNGDFEDNSAWVMVELALECTSPRSPSRPTIVQVLRRLQSCMPSSDNTNPVTIYFTATATF